jgi:asparagine synthetase A
MKNINKIFRDNVDLMSLESVQELIEYTRELEGRVFETNFETSNNKEEIYKSIIQDILTSCNDMIENQQLNERYPELHKKPDTDTLIKNLKEYILDMNRNYRIGLY